MQKNKGKGSKFHTVTKVILITLVALTFVIGGTAIWGVNKFRSLSEGFYQPLDNDSKSGKVKASELEGFHILLLGVDARDGDRGRSDTIILATVNPRTEEVLLVSIPRDTYVAIPGYRNTRINHAMAFGGVPLVKQTVENFLNIKIDHYLTIDFDGFQKAIDVLGGVHIDVERDMRYRDPTDGTNINIKKGYQLLDGKNALDYVRYRSDAEADFGRMRRQQEFIRAVAEKVTEFSSVTRVIPFVDAISKGIKTDIHPNKLEALIRKFFGVRGTAIQSAPIESRSYIGSDGLWYVEITKAERERIGKMLNEFKNKKENKVESDQENANQKDANQKDANQKK